jgi:hypothetical protein
MAEEAVSTAVDTAPAPEVSNGGPDWRAGLPPDLLTDKSLESFKSVGDLAKSYVETKRMVGAPLTPPGADAKPEQLAAYRQRLGVPEGPDKYEFELPPTAEGSGFQWDPNAITLLKQRAHAAHMTPAQTRAMLEVYQEHMLSLHDRMRAQEVQEEQSELTEAVKVLEQKWGPRNGPQWRHHQARAETAIRTLLADATEADRQEVLQLANHPAVAHALSQLADGLLERGFIDGQEIPAGVTASDAQRKADELWAEAVKDRARHPLTNRAHPDHQRVYDQFLEWNRIAAGDGSQYRRYPTR